jgi:dihydrolipoamide dehydrogenase
VLGGGPVGIELAQILRGFGAEVHLVESADRLLAREDERVSELLLDALRDDGIDFHLGVEVTSVATADGHRVAQLSDGQQLQARELVVATGRAPRVAGLGLESVGIEPDPSGIPIDERCRAGNGIWAIGDCTGAMPFTHVAKYHARIVCAELAGTPQRRRADLSAIPRVVFSNPEVAGVGLTDAQARERGIDYATARVELASSISRPSTYENNPRGELGVIADRARGVLVGAWAVAPLAGEWIHYAALAIKVGIPIGVLSDTVAQFPTYTEGYLEALEKLDV